MLTDDGNAQHVSSDGHPTEKHAPNQLKGTAGSLEQTGAEGVESKALDQAGDEVGHAAVQDTRGDAHKQQKVGLAVEEGLFDVVAEELVVLDAHTVLGYAPHRHHAFILAEHLGIVRAVGEPDEDDETPSKGQGSDDLGELSTS